MTPLVGDIAAKALNSNLFESLLPSPFDTLAIEQVTRSPSLFSN